MNEDAALWRNYIHAEKLGDGVAGEWIRSAYGQPSKFTYWNMEVAFTAGWKHALAATGKQQVGEVQGDAPIDVTDPWRGLYQAARLPAPTEYGDIAHPDIPSWPDDREDALDKLVHAQGFDFQIVAGEFTEAAMDDGDELYWQEMRAWNPDAPDGDWRLAWKGDTDDGPYAWFVRPMALRPESAALAARQPGEASPEFTDTERAAIAWVLWHHQGGSSPVGQPLRYALGMGSDQHLSQSQIDEAKRFAEWIGATTDGFHRHKTEQGIDLGQFWEPIKEAVHTALSAHAPGLSNTKRETIAVYVARQLRDGQRDAAPGVK